jgi:predicted AlkP superfamily phosphohydrolase/phosphomutase
MLNIFKRKAARRVVVLSLDGVPYSFLNEQIARGRLPNLRALMKQGTHRKMNSVQPCISSVAWSSYLTGKNPGKHNIFGFIDRRPGTFDLFVPTSRDMSGETLMDIMGRNGKRVFAMNIPVTYPPRQVNGIQIGCFLCTQIEKVAYPANVSRELQEMGYRIDAEASIARENLDLFLQDCNQALTMRAEALFRYLKQEPWDFFQCHVMETDRMNHFFWSHMERGDPTYQKAFLDFYARVDALVGEVSEAIGPDIELVILSDHGFCSIDKEMYLNYYLAEAGLLKLSSPTPTSLANSMSPESVAYSLIPGRVFINLKGREPNGSVSEHDYKDVRERVRQEMLAFKDPDSGKPIIKEVLNREDIYHGTHINSAADLIAVPHDGYDLKSDIRKMMHGEHTALVGMHTFDDALLYVRNRELRCGDNESWIADAGATVLHLMKLPVPGDMDGKCLVSN